MIWPTTEDGNFRHGRGSQTKRKTSKKIGGRHHRLVSDGYVCRTEMYGKSSRLALTASWIKKKKLTFPLSRIFFNTFALLLLTRHNKAARNDEFLLVQ